MRRRSRSTVLAAALAAAAAIAALLIALAPSRGPREPSGRLLSADLRSSTVTLVDVAGGAVQAQRAVASNPHELLLDGGTLYTTNYRSDQVTALDLGATALPAGAMIATPGRPHGIARDGDGRIWITSAGGAIHRLGAAGPDRAIPVGDTPHALVIDAERQIAYVVAAGDGAVVAVDLEAGVVRAKATVGAVAESIALSADGALIAVPAAMGERLSLLRAPDLQGIWSVAMPGKPVRVAFAGDTVLVSLALSGTMAMVGVADGALRAELPVGPLPDGIAVDTAGGYAFVAAAGADYVTVVDLRTATAVRRLPAGEGPSGLLWLPG